MVTTNLSSSAQQRTSSKMYDRSSQFIHMCTVGTVLCTRQYVAPGMKKRRGQKGRESRQALRNGTPQRDSKCVSCRILLGSTERRRIDTALSKSDKRKAKQRLRDRGTQKETTSCSAGS